MPERSSTAGGETDMKTTLLMLIACFALSTTALAQYMGGGWALDNQAHPTVFASHDQHAYEAPLAPERDLYVRTATVIAQGETPLWEFPHPEQTMPLGDIARLLREQHATVKKAVKVLEQ